jgi:hypothetical protein
MMYSAHIYTLKERSWNGLRCDLRRFTLIVL